MKKDPKPVVILAANGAISGVGRWLLDTGLRAAPEGRVKIVIWGQGGAMSDAAVTLGYPVTVLCGRHGRDVRAALRWWRLVRSERPELVHLTEQPLLSIAVCRLLRVSYTCSIHVFPRGKRGRFARRFAASRARVVVASSPAVVDVIKTQLGASPSCLLIPPGTSEPAYVRCGTATTPILVLPTRLAPGKGLEVVPALSSAIISSGRSARIRIVQGGSDPRGSAQAATGDHIEVLPPTTSLDDLYQEADAVLFVSEEETFGRTLIEGMARGLPAIGPRRGSPQEWVLQGVESCTYWAEESGADGVSNAVLRFLNDPPRQQDRARLHHLYARRYHASLSRTAWQKILAPDDLKPPRTCRFCSGRLVFACVVPYSEADRATVQTTATGAHVYKCVECESVSAYPLAEEVAPSSIPVMYEVQDEAYYSYRKSVPTITKSVASKVRHMSPRSLLDVGSGDALFLESLRGSVPFLAGADLSQHARGLLEKRGFGTIDLGVDDGRKFECVTALDVLEHVDDPVRFVRALLGRVEPGGALIIQTGDASAKIARHLLRWWYYVRVPGHVGVPEPEALRSLLERLPEVADVQVERTSYDGVWREALRFVRVAGSFVVRRMRGQSPYPFPYFCDHVIVTLTTKEL